MGVGRPVNRDTAQRVACVAIPSHACRRPGATNKAIYTIPRPRGSERVRTCVARARTRSSHDDDDGTGHTLALHAPTASTRTTDSDMAHGRLTDVRTPWQCGQANSGRGLMCTDEARDQREDEIMRARTVGESMAMTLPQCGGGRGRWPAGRPPTPYACTLPKRRLRCAAVSSPRRPAGHRDKCASHE